MNRPHIAFVSPTLYPVLTRSTDIEIVGGAEVQQAMIIRMLRLRGYRISVVTGDFGQPDDMDWNGITIRKLPAYRTRGFKPLRFIHPRLTDCVALLREQRPDIVYMRMRGAYLAACAHYCRRNGARLVYASAHDLDFLPVRDSSVTRRDLKLFRWGLRRTDSVFVQNLLQLQQLRSQLPTPAQVVPNCYEEPAAVPARFDGPVVFVGTVKPVKRPELFIDLARAIPERQFKLVGGSGPGADGKRYVEAIRARCASVPNLQVVGFVPYARVHEHFDGASLLVNTSEMEGFPNTFLQAWVRGIPTVSFVAPEVEPGVCGTRAAASFEHMLVDVRNLLSQSVTWDAASAHCLAHFQRFHTPEAVFSLYDAAFTQLGAAV